MLKEAASALIRIYQRWISVCLPASCRFTPSCSEYSRQAILRYGFLKGGARAFKRILFCQPFSKRFGDDPVD